MKHSWKVRFIVENAYIEIHWKEGYKTNKRYNGNNVH